MSKAWKKSNLVSIIQICFHFCTENGDFVIDLNLSESVDFLMNSNEKLLHKDYVTILLYLFYNLFKIENKFNAMSAFQ